MHSKNIDIYRFERKIIAPRGEVTRSQQKKPYQNL